MTEDRSSKPSEEPAGVSASATKQRRKRKWDQPAEYLVSAAVAVPGVPLGVGGISGISLPGSVPISGGLFANLVPPSYAASSQLLQSASIPHSAAAIVQKLSQPKIQDELIAREIVINDAEPTIRYKLTKRQTQEEIQKFTGAVVITRGKYRPPNGLPDNEKPLYLHISAGSHLKDTAERIKAVDSAASMIEEILKQGQISLSASIPFNSVQTNGQVAHPLTTCLSLGFNVDPSLNIAARIRGPNDQYINHIVNETGATVELRGQGFGNIDSCHSEGAQQSLHLYLSSSNAKSLEAAKVLAENLLDTIAAECGVSRIPSSKVYSAVPPPQQFLAGVQSSTTVPDVRDNPVAGLQSGSCSLAPSISFSPTGLSMSIASSEYPSGASLELSASASFGNPSNVASYKPPLVTGGTCYSGYGGIYPQATPLQQVALALKQAPASTASAVPSATSLMNATLKMSSSTTAEADKRPPQKRKFQELPVSAKGPVALNQNSRKESEFLKPGSEDSGIKLNSTMPPPRKLVESGSIGAPPRPRNMPPPPPKFMPPQSDPVMERRKSDLNNSMVAVPVVTRTIPIPPKFSSPQSPPKKSATGKSNAEPVSDTLLKLMEYGEEDDDPDDSEEFVKGNPARSLSAKPFWAV
ncbi:protein RIK isoform X1 [Typha latifolia]|uniref:protein RIK isoform X1 n=1 Tax=Typha latifolia TaxID=4733 RepID=UPI003C2BFC78